jgi:predicted phage terminase large subunit-like protein
MMNLRDRALSSPSDHRLWGYLFEYARVERDKGLVGEIQTHANKQARALAKSEWLDLYWKCCLFAAPYDLDSYLLYVERGREAPKKFYIPRRSVLRPAVAIMQDLEDDKLDLAAISCPPGIGKTTLGLFYMSWLMGKHPEMPNLASAHSDKLTRSFFEGVNTIITDLEYKWADVFPGVKYLGTNAKDETINLDKNKRFKSLTCRSIGGGLTGATRCEKLLYADDLVSGIEEALSIDRMNKLFELYTNDLKSRKKEGCKELHIATRWSVHDVLGRLERQYEDDPRAKFFAMPALDENDESNFEYLHGVGFSTRYFLDMRASLDDVSWRCLFQNEPIEREGLLYHGDELNRYFTLPDAEPDAILGVCDTKDTGTDYCFLPIAHKYGDKYYITTHTVCDNSQYEVVDARIASALVDSKCQICEFESNSAGGRVADKAQENVKALGGRCHITTKFTTANKETKIIVNAPWVKEHCYFLDKTMYEPNSDYGKMMRMLCSYTIAGKKNRNDDVPDGIAIFAEMAQRLLEGGSRVTVFARPF